MIPQGANFQHEVHTIKSNRKKQVVSLSPQATPEALEHRAAPK